MLAAVQRMDGLGGADAGHVAITLIGEHEAVGPQTLDGGSHGGSTSMGGLLPVDIDILIGEHGAAYGRDADGLVGHTHFFNHLGHELVDDTMRTARAIVHGHIVHQGWFLINQIFRTDYIFH